MTLRPSARAGVVYGGDAECATPRQDLIVSHRTRPALLSLESNRKLSGVTGQFLYPHSAPSLFWGGRGLAGPDWPACQPRDDMEKGAEEWNDAEAGNPALRAQPQSLR